MRYLEDARFFFVLIVYFLIKIRALQDPISEDGRIGFCGLAVKYGHSCEEYNVKTLDSYILKLYRIPKLSSNIVLFIHGAEDSGNTWIIRGQISWAIVLADLGYDVWVINCRGNSFSRKHDTLNPDTDSQFWNFSFYENGVYDIPDTIDFILDKTGKSQLSIIGHSMGTTSTFVLGCEKPEYNKKIKVLIALAPVFIMENKSKFHELLSDIYTSNSLDKMDVNSDELLNYNKTAPILHPICLNSTTGYVTCIERLFFFINGYDPSGFEKEFLSTFFGYYPAGISHKTMKHLSQVSQRNKFANYDYGEKNQKVYNSTSPPEFNLNNIKFDVILVFGKNDPIATIANTEKLRQMLTGIVETIVLDYDKFNHFDFVIGKHMPITLYPKVLEILRRYN